MTIRWILSDPATSETWTMPINPDAMSSPQRAKQLKFARGSRDGHDRARSFLAPPQPVDWTWEGVIRTRAHYDELLRWSRKSNPIEVTDHLGRTWVVVIRKFEPTDRQPNGDVPVRMRYRMNTWNLGASS